MSNQGLPIIFIHKGFSDYLEYSLKQAKKMNPDSDVVLIGDESLRIYEDIEGIKFCLLDTYLHGEQASQNDYNAAQFESIFKDFSTNGKRFELRCFQRWFILREFMKQNQVEKCLYLDSDCLIFTNVTHEQEKFNGYDFTCCAGGPAQYINRYEALDHFVMFICEIYEKKNKYLYHKFRSHYLDHLRIGMPGGTSDMQAFHFYKLKYPGRVFDTSMIIDGAVHDANLNIESSYIEMKNGHKNIIFKEGIPFGKHKLLKQLVKMNLLHFQGKAKKLIPLVFNEEDISDVCLDDFDRIKKSMIIAYLRKVFFSVKFLLHRIYYGVISF
jgi:hypothetical protein